MGEENDMPEINNVVAQPPTLQTGTPLLKTKQGIAKARENSVLFTTCRHSMWCLGVWKDWSCSRNSITDTNSSKVPSNPASCSSTAQLSHWLEAFVLEISTKQGKEYSPDTLHHLFCGILGHL